MKAVVIESGELLEWQKPVASASRYRARLGRSLNGAQSRSPPSSARAFEGNRRGDVARSPCSSDGGRAGFREAVKGNSNLEIAAVEDARWDTATSERTAGQLYARFAASGGVDAVYGMADNQAVAAIRAAEAAGITVGTKPKQLLVVGGNCLKEGLESIKADKMHNTVTQIPTDLGVRSADAINEHFAGAKLPKNIYLPITTVTKANVGQWEKPCTY